MPKPKSPIVRRCDYRPPQYRLDRLKLDVAIHAQETRVVGEMHITPLADQAVLTLYGDGTNAAGFQGMAIDGKPHKPKADELAAGEMQLVIKNPTSIRIQQKLDPAANATLEGLYKANGTYCTQCEAEGFRRILWYPDRPDVLAPMQTRIEADKSLPVLLAGGNRLEAGAAKNNRHYVVWDDPHPKPSYLFALVAGDLQLVADTFTTATGREVALRVYVEHGNAGRAKHALASLKRAMAWDEATYGLSYDLDVYNIVAVSHFNMGAMENKGLNIFNAKYVLADKETATDDELQQIEAIIAHEYFHNWTGNRVTCRDWFQLTLKEGLTVFRDQQFTAAQHSPAVKRIQDVAHLRAVQFPEDASPTAHPIRPNSYQAINNFYTPTVYEKGAEVVRMLWQLLGQRGFMAGMKFYFKRHDGEAVACEDFIAAMADANKADLKAFCAWYGQAGTPRLSVKRAYDKEKNRLTLHFSQSHQTQPATSNDDDAAPPAPLLLPIRLGLLSKQGKELPVCLVDGETGKAKTASKPSKNDDGGGQVVVLTKKEDSFHLANVPDGAVPSMLRGFSAPVVFQSDLTDDERLLLLAQDSDSFCRWQAAQDLMLGVLLDTVRVDGFNRDIKARIDKLALALGKVFASKQTDAAFLAELIAPPSQAVVEEAVASNVDPVQIWRIRRKLRRALAGAMADALQGRMQYLMERLVRLDAGKRRLLASLVLMLADANDSKAITHAITLAQHDRMTLCMAGLRALNQLDHSERLAALNAFADKWQHDALMMEKYFALAASAPLHATPDYCEELMQHPAFDSGNPNKLRAVIGVFASANIPQFHAADGKGYRFLTKHVAAIDKRNPQMAARLVLPLTRYGRYGRDRQAMMRGGIIRLKTNDGQSPDLAEIIDKTLAQHANGNGKGKANSTGVKA